MTTHLNTAVKCAALFAFAMGTAHAEHHMVPDAVKVPDGNEIALKTKALGHITYECQEKKDAAGQFAWTFKIPHAHLYDSENTQIGRYYGSSKGATWEANDGSKVIGKQLAVTPNTATPDSIPLQLVQQNGYEGSGAMSKISYIQRLHTVGGVAPKTTCDAASKGKKEVVAYSADYLMWSSK